MMSSVLCARLSVEVKAQSKGTPFFFRMVPARWASAMPSSVRPTSFQPVKRFDRFHSLSPWRTRTRTFSPGGVFALSARPVIADSQAPPSRLLGGYGPFRQIPNLRTEQASQAKHVGHRIKSRGAAASPQRRLDRAASENPAIGGDMGKLDALAGAGEDHPVLADHVAAAERGKADIAFAPRPDIAVASPHAALVKGDAPRLGQGAAEQKRRPRRRIALVAMMHLQDLDIEFGPERRGHARGKNGKEVHAPAHIARLDYGGVARGSLDFRLVGRGKAGRADDMDDTGLRRKSGEGDGRSGRGEIEHPVDMGEDGEGIVGNSDAERRKTGNLANIAADMRRALGLDGPGHGAARRLDEHPRQRLAHASGRSENG